MMFSLIRSDFFDSFLSLVIFIWIVKSYLDKESERTMNAHSTDSGFVERIREQGRRTDGYGEEAGRPNRNGRQKRGGNKKKSQKFFLLNIRYRLTE
jgi:hypothetical protein